MKQRIQYVIIGTLFLLGCKDRGKNPSIPVQPQPTAEMSQKLSPSRDAESPHALQQNPTKSSTGNPGESAIDLAHEVASLQKKGDREGALRAMGRLMDKWSPVGLTHEEVAKMLGEPDPVRSRIRPNEMVYWLDTGRYGCEWTLETRDGVVTKVVRRLGD